MAEKKKETAKKQASKKQAAKKQVTAKKTDAKNRRSKTKKVPGIFKKPVKKAKWEKKFLKKLYLPDDKKFLKAIAVEKDGFVSVDVSGLSAKDFKRLKALGEAIKKNRKGINFILIFILAVIIGGGVFFQVYLKNKLVQRLIETQMEKIFLAEVDTRGVNLSIFKGELSLGYLAIADVQNPMMNLIEFTRVEADIDTADLLQGRVFIEELGFSGLVRGSERTVSGALSADAEAGGGAAETAGEAGAAKDAADSGGDVISDVVTQVSALVGEIDVEEILEQQKANLESFRLIEESRGRVEGYADHWEGRVDEWSGKIDGWEPSVDYIKTVNAGSFTTMESAQSTIARLQGIYSDAESDYTSIQADYSAAEQQYAEAAGMMSEIRTAVEHDYDYIESLITMPASDKLDWASSILGEQISAPIKKYLSYLDRGLEWYGRFKKLSEIREKKSPEKRRDGRSLPEPAGAPPKFVLVHAFASGEEPDLIYRFDLNNLASEPEKWDGKTSLDIGVDTSATGAAKALITEDSLSLDVPAAPFDLGSALDGLDIAAFSGILSVASDTGWDEGEFSGMLDLGTPEIKLASSEDESLLFRLINTTVESVKPVTAVGDYTWNETDGLDLSLDTNLDDGLGNAFSALLSEGADEGLKMLKDYLGKQLDGPLADFDSVQGEFEGYVGKVKIISRSLIHTAAWLMTRLPRSGSLLRIIFGSRQRVLSRK